MGVKLTIKHFRVPVIRDKENQASFKEVELKNYEVESEEIELEESQQVVEYAKKISEYNDMQLKMATRDSSIETLVKKVLCK